VIDLRTERAGLSTGHSHPLSGSQSGRVSCPYSLSPTLHPDVDACRDEAVECAKNSSEHERRGVGGMNSSAMDWGHADMPQRFRSPEACWREDEVERDHQLRRLQDNYWCYHGHPHSAIRTSNQSSRCPPAEYPVVSKLRVGRASLGSTCNVRFQNRGFILNGTDETVTEGKTLTNESLFSPACLHD
jgi:hypothetical protein